MDMVAMLGGKPDEFLTVPFVKSEVSGVFAETDDFISRKRIAVRTSAESGLLLLCEV